jgi:2-keto-4-pentenoate hydratase/2-oxohepta-3-ene-1,7-dioic acid hydratase in catechol pathway
MKIYRFKHNDKKFFGVLKEDRLYPIQGSVFRKFKTAKKGIPVGDVTLLPPIVPSKIVAIGLNYKDHAMERGRSLPEEPLIFLKPSSAVVGPNDIIV